MKFEPQLPKTREGIISSVLTEMCDDHPDHDPHWYNSTLVRIKNHDPILGEFLEETQKHHGKVSALTGMFVYRILESQIEANKLEEMFSEDS